LIWTKHPTVTDATMSYGVHIASASARNDSVAALSEIGTEQLIDSQHLKALYFKPNGHIWI